MSFVKSDRVFEDLRIGQPLQSLRDGVALRHTALRLAVVIEVPAETIDRVIDRHVVVRELVFNGWLHLLRIAPEAAVVGRRTRSGWADETA